MTRSLSSAGVGLDEAREAHAYWRDRLAGLPWHKRAARREARTMVERTRRRLVHAHLDRRGLGQLAPLVSANYKRWLWLLVRRNPFTRRLLMMATVAAASAAALLVLGMIVVAVVVF